MQPITMESTLKKYFGYSGFRPYQKEVIEKILQGRDCLVVMATGSGKSLCYQVPPLIVEKTAVVVSPLISLMQDQVMALKQRGIRAEFLGSAQSDHSVQFTAQTGHFHLLFMTPEKACAIPPSFWSKLLQVGICMLAVDEAHCISEWGHDFRVEYKRLDKVRDILSDVPFVSLTATATEKVRADIINSLNMKNPYLAIGSFDRKNLFYGVKQFSRGLPSVNELVQEISKFAGSSGSTIIYCTTIKDVEQISKSLQEAGIRTAMYHGQMGTKAREEAHRLFIRDELHVMVATIAFGMGIDKPNVRQVIHYGCPKSLESYYQESGRCGRDGIASVCWLYYTRSDFAKADFYCGEVKTENQRKAVVESLLAAQHYCLLTTCRRKFLLHHFGENFPADTCGNCDNCLVSKRKRDMSKEAFLLLACVQSCGGKWGLNMPVDVLHGSRAKKIVDAQFDKLPLHGLGKQYPSNWWKALGRQLISHDYLVETVKDVYVTIRIGPKGMQYLASASPDHQPPLVLPLTEELDDQNEKQNVADGVGDLKSLGNLEREGFSELKNGVKCNKSLEVNRGIPFMDEGKLYNLLLEERLKLARSIGTAPYAICGDQTIKRIALTRPSTKARLANIDGVNQHLVMTHGDVLLKSIERLSKELNLSMDGEAVLPTPIARKAMSSQTNNGKKLSPAKLEAWKLWLHAGQSIQKIANFPTRSAPIKEQTVCEYLLEAAQEGLEMDWPRFCNEIGLTTQIFKDIQVAIAKVGSKERLKPIKNELPEDVSYAHIKTFFTMADLGVSLEASTLGDVDKIKANELINNVAEIHSTDTCNDEGPHEVKTFNDNVDADDCLNNNEKLQHVNRAHKDQLSPNKRQKVNYSEGISAAFEATEDSILKWIESSDKGVSLSDILKHFDGSKKDSVMEILNSLESDFLIFKMNDLYRLCR